jgi:EF-P beta-lysylation protein EpmB
MLQRNLSSWQRPLWQQALAKAINDPIELLRLLELPPDILPASRGAARQFPLRVPLGYVARMRKGDPADPLLRQVLPIGAEEIEVAGFRSDPVGDLDSMPVPGVLHKYRGRVLLIATGACGIHCRYCFRRHFPYGNANSASGAWRKALDYIAADSSIIEVILSGGDPLALPDNRLAELAAHLGAIPHIKRLRIHSRLPIVLPERVDSELLAWLGNSPLQKVMVVHANHPNEIGEGTAQALRNLRERGITVLNQTVLLRGVNDSAAILAELSEALFAAGVMPYYLHLLDRVQGAAHFDVPEKEALILMGTLQSDLPGYLVPRLVRELPGAPAKMPVNGIEKPDTDPYRVGILL